jgi:hypothetical protein
VKVGQSEKIVHKGLICHYSEYFRGAFEGGFKESEGLVTLGDEDEEAFLAFFAWLYKGKIVEDTSKFDLASPKDTSLLAKIYVFGDARGIPVLRNAAIDLFITKRAGKHSPIDIISYIYENTPENDNFRKLFVDLFAYCPHLNPRFFCTPNEESKYPHRFLFEVLAATMGSVNKQKPAVNQEDLNSNKCRYHDHTDINALRQPDAPVPASLTTESAPNNSSTPFGGSRGGFHPRGVVRPGNTRGGSTRGGRGGF